MKFAVLGTGTVGSTIADKLLSLGHEVRMGSRSADNENGKAWLLRAQSPRASLATFAEAAGSAEVAFNCTAGVASLDALAACAEGLAGKLLIDLANPLDFSQGFPPRMAYHNDSLGERIQARLPTTKVVKTLNTVNCNVMVEPSRVPGEHVMFMAGNDAEAKAATKDLLESFGWRQIIDLGDITAARATEGWLPLWVRLYGALKTADFNIALVRA